MADMIVTDTSQRRAVENHRSRMRQQGLGRFEVRGLETDKPLIRALASQLAKRDAAAAELRGEIERRVGCGPGGRGGILAALRRSPMVGADLDLEREIVFGRDAGP